jgi:hypothetical protein
MLGRYCWSGVGGAEGDRTPDLRAASAGSTCSCGFVGGVRLAELIRIDKANARISRVRLLLVVRSRF